MNKFKNILPILIIFIFGAGLFVFLYLNMNKVYNNKNANGKENNVEIINKEEDKDSETQIENEEKNKETSYVDKNIILIDEYKDNFSYTFKYLVDMNPNLKELDGKSFDVTVNARLISINDNSENAIKLNNLLRKDREIFYDKTYKTSETIMCANYIETIQDFLIKDNYLFVTVKDIYGSHCGDGGIMNHFYYYDMENDKLLTTKEAFEVSNLSLKTKKTYDNQDVTYERCDQLNIGNNACGCGIQVVNNELSVYFEDTCK